MFIRKSLVSLTTGTLIVLIYFLVGESGCDAFPLGTPFLSTPCGGGAPWLLRDGSIWMCPWLHVSEVISRAFVFRSVETSEGDKRDRNVTLALVNNVRQSYPTQVQYNVAQNQIVIQSANPSPFENNEDQNADSVMVS